MRQIEEAILRKVARGLIDAGMNVSVYDGEEFPLRDSKDVDAIIKESFASYETSFTVPGGQFVYFIHGNGNNGLDVISDYTVSLASIIDPIIEWTNNFPDGWLCTEKK